METLDGKLPVIATKCFVCGGNLLRGYTPQYLRCSSCGHEVLAREDGLGHMLNDPLEETNARDVSALDRFKAKTLQAYLPDRNTRRLVDVGSATGKFLLQNARYFDDAVGIEVTPAAVEFSRGVLGLKIVTNISEIDAPIDLACAWHSLEHIPPAALNELLDGLESKMPANGLVVVSVPNCDSFQYRIFRSHYTYFDVPNHIHQFSPQSLTKLFVNHGFHVVEARNSGIYNVFGYFQSILNLLPLPHNYFYYRLKRKSAPGALVSDVINLAAIPLALPLAIFLSALDRLFPRSQGVLTVSFGRHAGKKEP